MATNVLILRGSDEMIEAQAKRYKLPVVRIDGETDMPMAEVSFDRAIVVKPGIDIPWDLVPNGMHFVRRWDAACPLWRYNVTAQQIGTAEERKATEKLTLDLRRPVYACELLFVRGSEEGRELLRVWAEEIERFGDSATADTERLAFLRALDRIKPRLCTLPAEWIGAQRKRREAYRRHQGAIDRPIARSRRAAKGAGPTGLVRVEVGPGRYVQCRPENVERVKADYARRQMGRREREGR